MGHNRRPVRRNALVGSFGVGAIIDLPGNESLMVCGLDAWPDATARCPEDLLVHEERLEKRLNTTHFRLPAAFDSNFGGAVQIHNQIPCIRFPQWYFCPRCGAMEQLGMYAPKNEKCKGRHMNDYRTCEAMPERKRPVMNPMRFIAVCERGHIDDFPYMEWVHKGDNFKTTCQLRMRTSGSSASLASVIIECSCGEKRSMANSFNANALAGIKRCLGRRPWLGDMENEGEGCGDILRAAQRGAANVYFPKVVSSIHLPREAERFDDKIMFLIETKWDFFTSGIVNGEIDESRISLAADMYRVDRKQLMEAVINKIQGLEKLLASHEALQDDEMFRFQEYRALMEGNDAVWQDFFGEKQDMSAYTGNFMYLISGITLMKKLRETRVQVGFSRLVPRDESGEEKATAQMSLDGEQNWLPASVVYGEGIFIAFDAKGLQEWSSREDVAKRIDLLSNRASEKQRSRGSVTSKFVMMHTLAHLLINQLSYECGYGSSSIRERIYCECNHPDMPMSGILLYTASGDSEGSLGGLVRQGEPGRFEDILLKALQNSLWCSSDPVCMQSHGQGPDALNLAACHNCSLLPETSCEERNMLLDRRMVTGDTGIWGTLDKFVID